MFDSGVGGLTVYMELKKRCPNVNIVYFADTCRQPYGPRNQVEVAEFCDEILHFLKRHGADVCIIACNTATAATFDNKVNERKTFADVPIFGTIPFASKEALKYGNRIGVLATAGTCRSGAYSRACIDLEPNAKVIQMPCHEFTGIVEDGKIKDPYTKKVALDYMDPCRGRKIDSLIYGCTHYPILSPVIKDVMWKEYGEPHVKLINPAKALVDKILERVKPCKGKPTTRFCVNADPEGFAIRANRILPLTLKRQIAGSKDVTALCELVDLRA